MKKLVGLLSLATALTVIACGKTNSTPNSDNVSAETNLNDATKKNQGDVKPVKQDDAKPVKQDDAKPVKQDDVKPVKPEDTKPVKQDDVKPDQGDIKPVKPCSTTEQAPKGCDGDTSNKQVDPIVPAKPKGTPEAVVCVEGDKTCVPTPCKEDSVQSQKPCVIPVCAKDSKDCAPDAVTPGQK